MSIVLFLVFSMAVCGAIGYAVGEGKGRGSDGALLGMFLGVIGIVIAAMLQKREDPHKKLLSKPGSHFAKRDPFEVFEESQINHEILPPPPSFKRDDTERE